MKPLKPALVLAVVASLVLIVGAAWVSFEKDPPPVKQNAEEIFPERPVVEAKIKSGKAEAEISPPHPLAEGRTPLQQAISALSAAPEGSLSPAEEDKGFTEVMAARKTLLADIEALESQAEGLPNAEAEPRYLAAAEGRTELAVSMVELPYPSYLSEGQILVYTHGVLDNAHKELDEAQEALERAGEGSAQEAAWTHLEGVREALEDQRPQEDHGLE